MLNSNLVHNGLNIVIVLVAAISAALSAYGCVTLPTGAFDCSSSTIPPEYTGDIIAALGVLKLIMNISRDGLAGLLKAQPPVEKK